ncbi:polysaccharide deacetylase family protein [Tissierella creatinophila]|uniref:Peptidoglycan-N-acetylmuramic acid deacetylase PdaA n=1 Tax=Tissierella creatinophila DSM 6911 TaxID=1123403 RepID=A0A1U7M5B7_TISCR|nr:polysaccharide deacetylase family protein [Tissierella creatinophila]OLS02450.1 peptidoglycan-N-acetylmuramic acid deacetylase PdaA precursor [Tissierella creatinophila DSM 6911]
MTKEGPKYVGYRMIIVFFTVLLATVVIKTNKEFDSLNVFSPTKELPIYSVERKDKKIAISFDAAYGDEYTIDILDTLDKYKVKTTFFLVKFWVENFPNRVEEIHKRGHEIGNHSATHPNMSRLSPEQIAEELNSTGDEIAKITKVKPTLFRPPFGDYNDTLIREAKKNGYYTIQWDVDSIDWKELGTQSVVDVVTRNVKPGSIILFHNNAKYVREYLPLVLERLIADGYEIVPISELIHKQDFKIDSTGKQIPIKQ